jgi:hypothetical protein
MVVGTFKDATSGFLFLSAGSFSRGGEVDGGRSVGWSKVMGKELCGSIGHGEGAGHQS